MGTQNKTAMTVVCVADFLATLEPVDRQADAQILVNIFETATGSKGQMWGPSIIGFGVRHYRYESGRTGETPIVSFSPRKAQFVIYGLGLAMGSPEVFSGLGRHSLGKGCLYIKRLADIDRNRLSALIATAWQSHGEASITSN